MGSAALRAAAAAMVAVVVAASMVDVVAPTAAIVTVVAAAVKAIAPVLPVTTWGRSSSKKRYGGVKRCMTRLSQHAASRWGKAMSLAPNLNTHVECLGELQSAANEAHRLAVVQPWLLPKSRLLIDSIVALLDNGATQVML